MKRHGMLFGRSILLAMIIAGMAVLGQPVEKDDPAPPFPGEEPGELRGPGREPGELRGGPGGGPGELRGGPGGHGPRMMPYRRWDMFAKTMEKLMQENPDEYQRLEELRRKDRTAYLQEIRKLMPPQFNTSSKVAELDRKCVELSRQYVQARTDAEKELIRKELEEAIQASSEAMIEDLKIRLEMMNKQLNDLEKNRETLNKKRLDSLLNGKKNQRGPRLNEVPRKQEKTDKY